MQEKADEPTIFRARSLCFQKGAGVKIDMQSKGIGEWEMEELFARPSFDLI